MTALSEETENDVSTLFSSGEDLKNCVQFQEQDFKKDIEILEKSKEGDKNDSISRKHDIWVKVERIELISVNKVKTEGTW